MTDASFPAGAGSVVQTIREIDWAGHRLGVPEGWPARLKAAVNTILAAPDPMFLAWGDDLTFFFNDGYSGLLGPRGAHAIGMPFRELWADIWPQIGPIVDKALAGEGSRFSNMPLKMWRYGVEEDAWFSFAYSPLLDENGSVRGMYCVTEETTEAVRSEAAWHAREARDRQILDSAIDYAIIATDMDGLITRWNEGASRVLGWENAEMIGHPAHRFFTPEDVAAGQVEHEMQRALDVGRGIDERWHLRKNGERFWASGEMTALRNDDDEVVGFVKVLRDRTEDRLAAEALRQSEAQLAEALDQLQSMNDELADRVLERTAERDRLWESSPDLLVELDFEGRLLRVNPAWTTILGYEPEDLIGRQVSTLVVPDDLELTEQALADARRAPLATTENRYRHKDGSSRWFSWVAAPNEHTIFATGRHVTEQRDTEAALRDEQDFARLALSAVGGVGVWTYDVASDRFFCDAAISRLYDLDPERGAAGLLRDEFLANVHPQDRKPLKAVMAGGLKRDGELELEYRLVHADGSVHWVLSRGHTYFDASGAPVRRTGIGVDMTSQRQVEDQLRQSQKMEALGQLTGGIAHDFNNLLTVIRGSAEMLQRPNLTPEKHQRYADAIADTADRASKLTSQLLSFARRQALTPEVFDVAASILALNDMVGTLTGSRVTVDVDVDECPCHVNADRTQFDTAIVNMAVNARDAMSGEGRLKITTRPVHGIPALRAHPAVAGKFVAVTLTDSGPGIPAEKIDHIFEPFFTTKAVGQGTGLGLSQVFGFAKQSGGEVVATNAENGGASFTLYLPLTEDLLDEAGLDDAGGVGALGQGTYILVVEDNAEVGAFATQALVELGYRTHWVVSGAEALAALATPNEFEMVFSDVVMPGMSGIELGQEIQRLYPSLPVILTSGYSDAIVQSGASGFALLQKPYSIGSLSRILQQRARGASSLQR
jgi:PAS domain S-box-containing protein